MDSVKKNTIQDQPSEAVVQLLHELKGKVLFPDKVAKLKADFEKNGLPKIGRAHV